MGSFSRNHRLVKPDAIRYASPALHLVSASRIEHNMNGGVRRMEFVWPVFLVVVVLWAALLRRQAKALGWLRFARRMVGFAFQSVGGTLAVAGISVLGSAIFGWFENGSWTAATLGQGLNDHPLVLPRDRPMGRGKPAKSGRRHSFWVSPSCRRLGRGGCRSHCHVGPRQATAPAASRAAKDQMN